MELLRTLYSFLWFAPKRITSPLQRLFKPSSLRLYTCNNLSIAQRIFLKSPIQEFCENHLAFYFPLKMDKHYNHSTSGNVYVSTNRSGTLNRLHLQPTRKSERSVDCHLTTLKRNVWHRLWRTSFQVLLFTGFTQSAYFLPSLAATLYWILIDCKLVGAIWRRLIKSNV